MIQQIEENKKAGFWIRALSLLIDIVIFSIIGILSSLMCIKKVYFSTVNLNIYQVKNDYTYFLWLLILILDLSIFFIAIPFLFNGKTIGMMITRLAIKYNEGTKKYWSLFKKAQLGPILWIVVIIFFMIFVWPTTINKMVIFSYIKNKNIPESEAIKDLLSSNKWNLRETIFYSIPAALSPIIIIVQLLFLISVGFKGNKIGLVDKFSNSQIIYTNKFDRKNIETFELIKPELYNPVEINWKE